MTINVIAPNLPVANLWAAKNNVQSFVYITDEMQVRREFKIVIINRYCGNDVQFSKEKKRLIHEVKTMYSRISYEEVF